MYEIHVPVLVPRGKGVILKVVTPGKAGRRWVCFSAAPVPFMAHVFLVLFPVQQVIENHILKLFQNNLVPDDPE